MTEKQKINKLLLEIGFEEIPADYLKPAALKLKELTEKKLFEKRIEFKKINVYYTVRRFVLYIEGIAEKQKDLSYEKKGPKYSIAYKDGKLTDVGYNFLKSNNLKESAIKIKEEKNEKYIYVSIFEKGEPTQNILKELFPDIIKNLNFPKTMKWEETGFLFARPIRWILCLFNNKIIKFSLASITSSNKTKAHKYVFDNKNLIIKNPDEYFKKIKKYGVLLDEEERKQIILEKIEKKLKMLNLKLIKDEELLEKVADSVESISVMVGEFDKKFLYLPVKVIITAMREHQRYFAVSDLNGKLTNYFINIKDGTDVNNNFIVIKHAEVLYARLSDAEFFYNEDLKKPLDENFSRLKQAIFITGLGTMYDKAERLVKIAEKIAKLKGYNATLLQKIAKLSKCDLITNMVEEKEFATLRGYMGGVYLEKQGEDKKVYVAVKDHYLPNFVGDELPETEEGAVISMIDKMDNLIGFFIAGFKPTGSKDPYAVRRQALNIIYLILNKKIDIKLIDVISFILDEYNNQFDKKIEKNEIIDFLKQREINYFKDQGIDYDIVNSVIEISGLNVLDDFGKAKVIQEKRSKKDFNSIIFAISRISNIIPEKYEEGEVKTELFDCEAEKNLYEKFIINKEQLIKMIENKKFKEVFEKISEFKPEIDNYFEKVLVMTEDSEKKLNRLNMLNNIKKVFYSFTDFSKIVVDRQ